MVLGCSSHAKYSFVLQGLSAVDSQSPVFVCLFVACACVHVHNSMHVQIKKQLTGVDSFLPPCVEGVLEIELDCQAYQQIFLPTKQSLRLLRYIYFFFKEKKEIALSWPRTCTVDQAGLELTEVCLLVLHKCCASPCLVLKAFLIIS